MNFPLPNALADADYLLQPGQLMLRDGPVTGHAVVVSGGRFARVGPAAEVCAAFPHLAPLRLDEHLLMPGLIAQLTTTLYNPNNIVEDAAPVSVKLELEVGRQLCRMVGFPDATSLGHLTGGGTVANDESLWLARAVPDAAGRSTAPAAMGLWQRLRLTLGAPGPWLVALSFAVYAGQWLAVIGFLPSIYLQAGVSGAMTGLLTALAAAVNMAGNIAAGRLLQAGVAPTRLLRIGFATMALAAFAAFAELGGVALPPGGRYAAVLLFSMVGGLIPSTLFALTVRVAPNEHTLSSVVGWAQQWSAFGQFAGPPLVAWVAARSGGWQWTWVVTGGSAWVGLLLAGRIAVVLRRGAAAGAAVRDNAPCGRSGG